MQNHPVGTIVRLKVPVLGNGIGTLGVCYENYTLGGIGTPQQREGASFIFENGYYDGFSLNEQNFMLRKVGFNEALAGYKFANVIILTHDYNSNYFDFSEIEKEVEK